MAMVIGGGSGGDGLEDLGCLLNDDEKPAPLFKSKPALTGQPWPHSHYIYIDFSTSQLLWWYPISCFSIICSSNPLNPTFIFTTLVLLHTHKYIYILSLQSRFDKVGGGGQYSTS
ncbi:hypothetical protein QYF36_015966 [Acer negundo]|nr:hypothetical protein QYF36_015966 [Acer negundo]